MTILQIIILDKEEATQVIDAYHQIGGQSFVDAMLSGKNPNMYMIFDSVTNTYSLRIKQAPCEVTDFTLGIIHAQKITEAIIGVMEEVKAGQKETD